MKSKKGYITPRILVGEGAVEFYKAQNPAGYLANYSENLQTDSSLRQYYRARRCFGINKRRKISPKEEKPPDTVGVICDRPQDTVGVICGRDSDIVCAVSTGGSVFKYPGRLGQCCTYGAGVWVEKGRVGVVTTGNGEQLINTMLAQSCARYDRDCFQDNLKTCFNDKLEGSEGGSGGFLMVRLDEGCAEVHVQHSLKNMVFGFQSNEMDRPKSTVLSNIDGVNSTFMEMFRYDNSKSCSTE